MGGFLNFTNSWAIDQAMDGSIGELMVAAADRPPSGYDRPYGG